MRALWLCFRERQPINVTDILSSYKLVYEKDVYLLSENLFLYVIHTIVNVSLYELILLKSNREVFYKT